MNAIGLYDIKVMGYRVKVQPYNISIFDEAGSIEGSQIPNKLVEYVISEGFCDEWLTDSMRIKVNVYRVKGV
jgi:hypothetical protein